MTQCERILQHLREHGSITSLEAQDRYGCAYLPARISDLKKQGNVISETWETSKNRYGESTTYKRYRLGGIEI